jgi:hypothetical protein
MEQRRRAAVVVQPSERRSRRQGNGVTSMLSSDAAATSPQPTTPHSRDADLSGSHDPGSVSTIGMFSPAVSSGAEIAGEPGPSTATVDFDAARVPEINRGTQSRHVQEAPPDNTGSSSMQPLRRKELIPDSMRKTTIANLETKTLKAFLPQYLCLPQECACDDFRLGVLHPSRASHTHRCGREFAVSSIRKPTRNVLRPHKWTSGRTWMC